jgi:hypothetical protein
MQWFELMPIQTGRIHFHEVKPMAEFDYHAALELVPTRRQETPAETLPGAFLEVNERCCGNGDIRRLYESAKYPLIRCRSWS